MGNIAGAMLLDVIAAGIVVGFISSIVALFRAAFGRRDRML